MSNSRLVAILARLKATASVKAVATNIDIDNGEFNSNQIIQIVNVTFATHFRTSPPMQTIAQPLLVVQSQLQNTEDRNFINRRLNAQNLIKAKVVPTNFNQTYLYVGDDGTLISQYANMSDLIEVINKPANFSMQEIKPIIGQMILAIRNYHDRNLVHRDISCENFFLNRINDKIHVKLGDHDGVTEVDYDGQSLIPDHYDESPLSYSSPELHDLCDINDELENTNKDLQNFTELDWRAVDCYALSICIWKAIVNGLLNKEDSLKMYDTRGPKPVYIKPPKNSEHDHLADLFYDLHKEHPEDRMTIEDAMNSEYFGSTPEARLEFFNNLVIESNILTVIDNLCLSPIAPEINDAFMLLDPIIKIAILQAGPVVHLLPSLTNLAASENMSLDHIKGLVSGYKSLTKTASDLERQIDLAKNSNPTQEALAALNELSQALREEMKALADIMNNRSYSYIAIMLRTTAAESFMQTETSTLFGNRPTPEVELFNQVNSTNDPQIATNLIYQFSNNLPDSQFKQSLRNNLFSVLHNVILPSNEMPHPANQNRLGL